MFVFACRPLLAGVVVFFGSGVAAPPDRRRRKPDDAGCGIDESAGRLRRFLPQSFRANAPVHGADSAEVLNERTWRDLQEVNTLVNRIVTPATDLEIYHRDEVWTLPETYGDCEDYVLLKRKWLIERGWPTSSLLITVVFDEVGDGHAVLLARTSSGDFVLDNKTDKLRRWYETAYRFVKRQSTADPNRWVSVGDPRWTTQNTATSR